MKKLKTLLSAATLAFSPAAFAEDDKPFVNLTELGCGLDSELVTPDRAEGLRQDYEDLGLYKEEFDLFCPSNPDEDCTKIIPPISFCGIAESNMGGGAFHATDGTYKDPGARFEAEIIEKIPQYGRKTPNPGGV